MNPKIAQEACNNSLSESFEDVGHHVRGSSRYFPGLSLFFSSGIESCFSEKSHNSLLQKRFPETRL